MKHIWEIYTRYMPILTKWPPQAAILYILVYMLCIFPKYSSYLSYIYFLYILKITLAKATLWSSLKRCFVASLCSLSCFGCLCLPAPCSPVYSNLITSRSTLVWPAPRPVRLRPWPAGPAGWYCLLYLL